MYKRGRPGYVTLTLEVPIPVADWLAVHGDELAQLAAIAVAKAETQSEAAKETRSAAVVDRLVELDALGRLGYRLFRYYCGTQHISRHQRLIAKIAGQMGAEPKQLELAIKRFKKSLDQKVRERRNREIYRLRQAGLSNDAIADRLKVHPGTVSRIISQLPGKAKSLKGMDKGALPGRSLGAAQPIPWEVIKQAGRRA